MSTAPRFIILSGDGINCEQETANALMEAGAVTRIVHINDLCSNPKILATAQGLALPGGFSFGDELGSGQILAIKLARKVMEELLRFIEQGGAIIGICNGFQTLVKLNLLPDLTKEKFLTLTHNHHHQFVDRWVELNPHPNCNSPWLSGVNHSIHLPIRHGEGRIAITPGSEDKWEELKKRGQIALSYTSDVNGSHQNCAALCDPSGMILALMPHPEVAIYRETTTDSTAQGQWGDGYGLFSNMIKHLSNQ